MKRKVIWMIHIVGAGPGSPDLITVRGQKLLGKADVVIYAGSLVNPELLDMTREGALIYDSARMTLEEVMGIPVFTGRSGSRWTGWMKRGLHMIYVRG